MSQPPSPSKKSRAKKIKKMSEEEILREMLKLQRELLTEHKTASLFTFHSKYGQLQYGSTNAVDKFRDSFANDDEWEQAFDDDHKELVDGHQIHDTERDEYDYARGTTLPKKLPADLKLMIFPELWKWLTEEILKEHWKKGGKLTCVKFGKPEFEPSFWLGDIWAWEDVTEHWKNLTRSHFPGTGTMTEFLKKVVKNRLGMFGINHKMWVDEAFGKDARKRRERNRKKSVPSDIDRQEEEHENTSREGSTDMDEGSTDMDAGNANIDAGSADIDAVAGSANIDDRSTDNDAGSVDDNLFNETFLYEAAMADNVVDNTVEAVSNCSNISNILLNNGVNLNSISNLDVDPGFATSTICDSRGMPRRCSARQAEKRARLAEHPPPPLSPLAPSPPQNQASSSPPSPANQTTDAQPSRSKFVPRRRKMGNQGPSTGSCGNFRSQLNVNVGQNKDDDVNTDIHIPSDLVYKFEQLSNANTAEGRETGGIIAGQDLGEYFQVTHLIIPQQTATSDAWEVHDERQITNFFVYHPDLIMLGLIHTHPRMTSFLSSVDLHALWDYARHNYSLVSIVLAPEKKTSPAFCLTSLGLTEIGKCKKNGFHKHRGDDHRYYREAGHAIDDQTRETDVIDYRI